MIFFKSICLKFDLKGKKARDCLSNNKVKNHEALFLVLTKDFMRFTLARIIQGTIIWFDTKFKIHIQNRVSLIIKKTVQVELTEKVSQVLFCTSL